MSGGVDAPVMPASIDASPRRRVWLHWLLLGVILLVAAELRFGCVVLSVYDPPVSGDSVKYISAAYNLERYGVFSSVDTWRVAAERAPAPDAMLPVGYPVLLSWLLRGPPDYDFLRRVLMLQVLLGTLIVAAGYVLARRLLSPDWALVVAMLLALCPQMVTLGTSVLTEIPFTLAVTGFLYSLVRAARQPGARGFAIAGVLLGVCVLIRYTLLYLPLFLLPVMLWLLPKSVRWRCAGALLLGFVAIYGPWLARNEIVLGRLGDPELTVNAILDGSYPDQMYQGRPETLGFAHRFDPDVVNIRTPAQAVGRVADNFRADPLGTLRWYVLGKPLAFYNWRFIEGTGDVFIKNARRTPYKSRFEFIWSHNLMFWLHWPLITLNFLGMALAAGIAVRHRGQAEARVWTLLVAVMVFAIAVHVIGYPLGRYSVPFRPLTYVFAMLPLTLAARRWLPGKAA
jgi:4-amino-4-deoxy-L-arabinose transferase-like glycosyltransferase